MDVSQLSVQLLPHDRNVHLTKLKAFADNFNVAQLTKLVCDRVENVVGEGGYGGYQQFLFSPQCFLRGFLLRVVKTPGFVVKG